MEAEVRAPARGDAEYRRRRAGYAGLACSHPRLRAIGPVVLITLLGLGLRVVQLNFQPLWWDEGYSVWFATHSLPQMAALTAEDIHPPLYYALLHLWTALAGTGPVALRLLSVMFGTATIPLIYAAGRRILANQRAGLSAALLLALNPLHIYYSQEVRMYGLVALLSTGILWAAWEVFSTMTGDVAAISNQRTGTNERQKRALHSFIRFDSGIRDGGAPVIYVLLTTAALYTQYYAVFLPIGLTLLALWRWRRDARKLGQWLAAQLAIALLYLPWVLYAAPRLVLYVSQKIVADDDRPLGLLLYLARHLAAFIGGHLEGPLAPLWPAALVLLVPIGAGLLLAKRRAPTRPLAFLLTLLATVLILGWLIALRYPFFPERGERLLLLALPAFVLLAAAALDALRARHTALGGAVLGLLVILSTISLSAFYTAPRYAEDDYRPLIARTVEQGLPEDAVFCVYPWQVGYWRSYGSPSGPAAVLTPATAWTPGVAAALDAGLAAGRVWFPAHLALGGILETQIEAHLGQGATPFANAWYGPGTRLSAWAAASAAPATVLATDVRFETPALRVTLRQVTGGAAEVVAANDILPLALAWTAPAAPPALAVSVRLTDDLGHIWAQHDYAPLGQMVGTAATAATASPWAATDALGVLIPAGVPQGVYHVEVTLRDADNASINVTSTDGRTLGPNARLFDVAVLPADRPLGSERLPVGISAAAALDNGIRFLGYTVATAPLTPGVARPVNLFWQAEVQPAADYIAFVQLLDRAGAPVAAWEAPPGAAQATSQWAAGALIRTQATLTAPAALPDGRYRLIAGLFRAGDGVRARTAAGRDALDLGFITVQGRPHSRVAPAPRFPADATFGAAARLVGYDLPLQEGPPQAGESIPLTLHWQALAATDQPFTVFVHLTDAGGAVWAYGDGEPGAGAWPTTGWLTGEYLADVHTVRIAADAPPGSYRLAIGLYNPATGERLLTQGGADTLWLGETITVR